MIRKIIMFLLFLFVMRPAVSQPEIASAYRLIFNHPDGSNSSLEWEDGEFYFNGHLSDSAREFFDDYLKDVVDLYILEKCTAMQTIEVNGVRYVPDPNNSKKKTDKWP